MRIQFVLISFVAFFMWMTAQGNIASAFSTSNNGKEKEVVATLGKIFAPVAKTFGCEVFVGGNVKPGGAMSELMFAPLAAEKDSKAPMTRMLHVQLLSLTKNPKKDLGLITDFANMLKRSTAETGKIISSSIEKNTLGEPILFLEYEAGQDAMKFHSQGIFERKTDMTAVYIQLMSWGNNSLPEDAQNIRNLVTYGTQIK